MSMRREEGTGPDRLQRALARLEGAVERLETRPPRPDPATGEAERQTARLLEEAITRIDALLGEDGGKP